MFIAPEQQRMLIATSVVLESALLGHEIYGAMFSDTIAQQNADHTELVGLQHDTTATQNDLQTLTAAEGVLKTHHISVPDSLGQLIVGEQNHLAADQLRTATVQHEDPHTPVDGMTVIIGVLGLSSAAYLGVRQAVRARRTKRAARAAEQTITEI